MRSGRKYRRLGSRLAILFVAAAMTTAACGSSAADDSPSGGSSSQQSNGDGASSDAGDAGGASSNADSGDAASSGKIVVGQVAEPKSLDPGAVTAVNDFRILVNIYDGLVRYASDSLDIEPSLATDWTVSDDGTVYTFNLRTDVKFTDGTPFNADAVVFDFNRMLVDGAPGSDTGPFPLADQYFGEIKDVTAVDDSTVKFTLKDAFAPFLANLAYPIGLLASPTAIKKDGADFGHNPVGTGAFKFDSWQANQQVVLTANADYWDGAPKTSNLIFRTLPDASARVAAVQSGDADVVMEVPADNLQQLKDADGVNVQSVAGPHVWFLILNAKDGPFSNKLVRQAANYAINKKAIVDQVLQGTATVAKGPIAPAFGAAYDDSLTGYPYDLDKAKALMKQAGLADGADVTFDVTSSGSGMLEPKAMAEAIQAQLGEIGLRVHIKTFEWNTYLDKVNGGLDSKTDMAEMAWMTNDPGSLPYLTLRTGAFPDKGGFNSGYYSNPKADKLINESQVTADVDARNDLFHQMQQIVVDDAPWVFVANGSLTAAMTDHLQGFKLHPAFGHVMFHDAYIK